MKGAKLGKYSFLIALLLFFSFTAVSAQREFVPSKNADVPVSYGIIVDNSGSARASLDKIIKLVEAIVDANAETDETFFVRFTSSDKISLVEELTKDKSKIREAANDLYIDRSLTAIIDAVEFSAEYLDEKADQEAGRKKVLLLITDGEESQSRTKIDEALKFLKEKNIKVFSIGISDEKVTKKILDKLADGTGGKIFVPKDQAELTAATDELIKLIRAQ